MANRLLQLAALALLLGSVAAAPATQPSDQPLSLDQLQVRADQAFAASKYVTALPIYKRLATQIKEKDRLGAIEEKIRVCQKNLASDPAATLQLPGQQVATNPEARKPHSAPKPGETLDTSIKELGNFDYDQEKGGDIPKDVRRLTGSKIRVKGFMIPMDQAQHITQFALVPSLFACCYGQPPQIQHTIVVNCPKGKAVDYCPDEIVVEGDLKVEEKKDDGFVVSLFEVTAASVKPAPK
jgi:hypothetical protein